MIRFTVKGLAEYMTASATTQRRILRGFKYPDEDESVAKRVYYREARDRIAAFHRNEHDREWLREAGEDLSLLADLADGQTRTRLKHNARAIRQYEREFGTRRFEILPDLRLGVTFGDVFVSVVPDLHVQERNKEKLVKLDFAERIPPPELIRIVSQVMYEAAKEHVPDLTSSSILYLDVPRGDEHRGARAGARMLREIETTCDNIAAIWDRV